MSGRARLTPEFSAKKINLKVVSAMVELDQMKTELLAYESPLAEVRDSL